ncbi:uncharacterized protein [Mytilus edulis]|uniref:uncharacterized protein n=1 Tax=Mytilus edulis TaxID=6550 RepID=UPI0039F07F70
MTLQPSLFFVIVCFIPLLCFVSSLLRDESDYGCFVFVECPPGEEIKPCLESNGFYCKQCLPGYVQPNYVTSNQHNITCFKPISLCLAEDLTYSRKDVEGYCDILNGCKCNTNNCYYGDPCICNVHNLGCPVNTSLDENGVCQPCDHGTAKNDTGCGPCRAVYQKIHSLPGIFTAMVHTKRSPILAEETVTNSMKEGKNDTTSRSNPISNDRTFMAITICVAFLVLLLVIVIIVLCGRRKQCCFAQGNILKVVCSNGSSGANGRETEYMMKAET